MAFTPTTQNVNYFTVNRKGSPSVTFFSSAPTVDQWRNFTVMDEAYVPSTKQWYKLLSVEGNQASWELQSSTPSEFIDEIVTNSGDVTPILNVVNILGGTGISTSGASNTMTINSVGGGLSWSVVTLSTQSIATNNGYFANRGGGVSFSLPTTCNVGDVVAVAAMNAGGWSITQSTSQQIQLSGVATTSGASGSLTSTKIGDSVLLVCNVANTSFLSISTTGNITVV